MVTKVSLWGSVCFPAGFSASEDALPSGTQRSCSPRALTSDWLMAWLTMTLGGTWLSDELLVPLTFGPLLVPCPHQELHLGRKAPWRARLPSAPQNRTVVPSAHARA